MLAFKKWIVKLFTQISYLKKIHALTLIKNMLYLVAEIFLFITIIKMLYFSNIL